MKKAIKGHFGALRFTQKTTAAVLALLLAASVTACSGTQDSADTDTTVTTEEVGFKGGDVFVTDGYLSEVIYPIKENMVNYAVSLMESIYNSYLADGNHRVVVSVVPDKNIASPMRCCFRMRKSRISSARERNPLRCTTTLCLRCPCLRIITRTCIGGRSI